MKYRVLHIGVRKPRLSGRETRLFQQPPALYLMSGQFFQICEGLLNDPRQPRGLPASAGRSGYMLSSSCLTLERDTLCTFFPATTLGRPEQHLILLRAFDQVQTRCLRCP